MGLIADVVANTPITSAWGNAIRNRTIQEFANAAERAAQWIAPPDGAYSWLVDTPGALWVYYGGAWHAPFPLGLVAYLDNSSDVNIPGGATIDLHGMLYTYTPPTPNRKILVTLSVSFGLSQGTPSASLTLALCNEANAPYKSRGDQVFGSNDENMSSSSAVTYAVTTSVPMTFKGRAVNWTGAAYGCYAQDQTMVVQDLGGG
jgi:hypothetical protein